MVGSAKLLRFACLLFILSAVVLIGCGKDEKSAYTAAPVDLLAQLKSKAVVANFVDPGAENCQPLRRGDWHPPETNPRGGTHAWTRGQEAYLYLPVADPGPGKLVLVGYGLKDDGEFRRVELLVNGRSLGTETVPPHHDRIDWPVPPLTLRRGLNEVQIKVDRTVLWDGGSRQLGVLVDLLQFVPEGAIPTPDPYDQLPYGSELNPGIWRTAQMVHGAGSTLLLRWSGTPPTPPTVTVSELPGGESLVLAPPVMEGRNGLRLDLPADLPGCCWLTVAGEGVTLTEAHLESTVQPVDILLIVIDTLRPDFLGCYGHTDHSTPAIDNLAGDGILFENAVCHTPITGPSHANLFTSRLPSETGIVNNQLGKIPRQQPLLAEILAERGYDTSGAISISNLAQRFGFGRGFATFTDHTADRWILPADTMITRIEPMLAKLGNPGFFWAHLCDPHEPYNAHGLVERQAEVRVAERLVATIPTSTYTPSMLTLELEAGRTPISITSDDPFHLRNLALRNNKPKGTALDPRFEAGQVVKSHKATITSKKAGKVDLAVHLNDLIESGDAIWERYGREVTYCDRFVGVILDSLKAAGRYDDCLIIFTSDHGEALGENKMLGHIETLYDVMMKVPLIIKPPQNWNFKAGSRRQDQAALVDILPTVLAHLGIPALPGARGRDLLAPDANLAETVVFMETHRPQARRDLYGLRTDGAKIIYEPATEIWEFYDLQVDPKELDNKAVQQSEEFVRHRQLLLGLMAGLDLTAGSEAAEVEIDERTKESLRSLGY